jgi:hypothetical protein
MEEHTRFCNKCGDKNASKSSRPSLRRILFPNRNHEIYKTTRSLGLLTIVIQLNLALSFVSSIGFIRNVSFPDGIVVLFIYLLFSYYYVNVSKVTHKILDKDEYKKTLQVMKIALILYGIYYIFNFIGSTFYKGTYTSEEILIQDAYISGGIVTLALYFYFYLKTKNLFLGK